MKTVSEFAKENKVSVQTIYRKLNKVKHIHGDGLTEKRTGITYITALGESVLTEGLTNVKKNDVKALNPDKQLENDDVVYFKEQNRLLQEELRKEREHSRAQADKLAALAEQLAELSRNNQILLGAEQSRTNPALLSSGDLPDEETQPAKKRSFWGFFKKQ